LGAPRALECNTQSAARIDRSFWRAALRESSAEAMAGTTALAVLPQTPPGRQDHAAMKPYSGAPAKGAMMVYDTDGGIGHPHVNHRPAPAWADLGIVNHLEGAVVSEKAAASAGAEHLQPQFRGSSCLFRFVAVVLSLVENVLCYVAYFEAKSSEDSLYNKYEAYVLGYPGLDSTLLVFAVLSTVFLFILWTIMAFVRVDLYNQLTSLRLTLSLPAGGICTALVFFSDGKQVGPFLCATCVLLHLIVYLGHEYFVRRQRLGVWCTRVWFACIVLIMVWTASFVLMFISGFSYYLRDSDCPATDNRAMPVKIKGVDEWQCVKWGVPHYVRRKPSPTETPYSGLCSTSFNVFDKIANASTGATVSSSDAHLLRCPSYCQALGLGTTVVGCGVYSSDSSVCSAAVQMGILPANQGGVVKVVGRAPPPSNQYDRCNKNGVTSTDVPAVPAGSNTDDPDEASSGGWAFYFQVEGNENLDMIEMASWKKTSTPGSTEPWRSYMVDVRWVVGGTSRRKEVMLGPPDSGDQDIGLNFCAEAASCP